MAGPVTALRALNDEHTLIYQIFDVRLECNFAVPLLQECAGEAAEITVRLVRNARPDDPGFEWVHEWKSPSGTVIVGCARHDDEYLLRFPDLADFRIRPAERTVEAYPLAGIPEETVARLLVDQVIPRLLGHLGRVIVHAGAVVSPDGKGVAFIGDSGSGKSTLAASLYDAGWALVTDDCLQLQLFDGRLFALAAYPSLRLWPECVDRLYRERPSSRPVAHYSDKRQLIVDGANRVKAEPVELKALMILEDAARDPEDDRVEIEPVSGTGAAMAMIDAAFVLDVDSREAVQDSFRRVTRIAEASKPVQRLRFERKFEILPAVGKHLQDFLSR